MKITITASFKSSGTPQTGLSPTVTVWQIAEGNKTVIKTDQAMSELGNGIYAYVFDQFNALQDYLFLMDAGSTSDSRYLESEWNGYSSLIDLIPRGGGGGSRSVSITPEDIKQLSEGLKTSIEGMFENIEVNVETPEFNTSDFSNLLKDLKITADKEKKELLSLIEQAAKKVEEVKTPVIKTETVDISGMASTLSGLLEKTVKAQGSANLDEVEETLVTFLKVWEQKTEKSRDQIKSEVEAELIAEFKTKMRS